MCVCMCAWLQQLLHSGERTIEGLNEEADTIILTEMCGSAVNTTRTFFQVRTEHEPV